MLTLQNIVVYMIGFVCLITWFLFYFIGVKQAYLFETLEEKEYPFKQVYFVGYGVMQTLKYQYKSKHDRKLKKELDVLYTSKYTDYYIRVIYSQKVTISMSILILAFIVYGLSNDLVTFFIMIMFAGLAYYYFGTVTEKKILKRSDEMLRDFSEVISKLALLTNAGMILKEAWYQVAETGNTALYEEMKKAVVEMENGVSEIDALANFGSRCIIPEIKKFTSTITQGLVKGNSELTSMLQQQSAEVWNMKRQNIKRQGEKA